MREIMNATWRHSRGLKKKIFPASKIESISRNDINTVIVDSKWRMMMMMMMIMYVFFYPCLIVRIVQGRQTHVHRGQNQHHGRPLKGPETLYKLLEHSVK